MPTLRVSIGQAACNAVAAWLRYTLTSDVTVSDDWPEASVPLAGRTVSVIKVGKRRRLDVAQAFTVTDRTNLTLATAAKPTAKVGIRIGSYEQPCQIDVWTGSKDERDDLIDQLDDAFTAGVGLTLGTAYEGLAAVGSTNWDPVRDGILLQLLPSDGYSGIVEAWFDEPELPDDAETIQMSEYRATYFGTIRGDFLRYRTVPRAVSLQSQIQTSTLPLGQAATTYTPYLTTTISPGAPLTPTTNTPGVRPARGTIT